MADPQEVEVKSTDRFEVRKNVTLEEGEDRIVIKIPAAVAAGKKMNLRVHVDGALEDVEQGE